MSNLRYTEEHECLRVDGDVVTLGVTDYAKNSLGELVYIELPEVGDDVAKGDDFAVIESVKVASEVYSPVSGTIVEVNDALQDDPEVLKGELDTSWIAKIKAKDVAEIDSLMDETAYSAYLEGLDD